MSSLRDRLESRGLEVSIVTIRGERFEVREVAKSTRADILARNRGKDGRFKPSLDGELLSECVFDPDSGQPLYSVGECHKWDGLGSGFTGPLMAEVMRLNGLDDDDVGRERKNSSTTGS